MGGERCVKIQDIAIVVAADGLPDRPIAGSVAAWTLATAIEPSVDRLSPSSGASLRPSEQFLRHVWISTIDMSSGFSLDDQVRVSLTGCFSPCFQLTPDVPVKVMRMKAAARVATPA